MRGNRQRCGLAALGSQSGPARQRRGTQPCLVLNHRVPAGKSKCRGAVGAHDPARVPTVVGGCHMSGTTVPARDSSQADLIGPGEILLTHPAAISNLSEPQKKSSVSRMAMHDGRRQARKAVRCRAPAIRQSHCCALDPLVAHRYAENRPSTRLVARPCLAGRLASVPPSRPAVARGHRTTHRRSGELP